ncbi:MAG: hypothetical protein H0U73_11950 [Tatlockia sp.]|nr:hypothetical protein [Tatlockia sp.]
MLKKVYLALSLFGFAFSSVVYSECPKALATDNPNFCPSFKAAANCYCSSLLPANVCDGDVSKLASFMISYFGTLERACNSKSQKYTSAQDCLDNWKCYLDGGVDSRGRVCSSNGSACPK